MDNPAGLWPRITVVTPSFNQAPFLERTIRSVLSQGYPNLEYFLFDAGSTDGSANIIQRYSSQLAHYEIGPDRGQSDAINKGWKRATGEVLCWLNSDDYYEPGALHLVGQLFREKPDLILLCGTMAIVDRYEKFLWHKQPPVMRLEQLLPWGRVPGQPSVFLRRQVFESIGGPRLDLHYVMDWEYWLRVLLHYDSTRVMSSKQILACARDWEQAKTRTAAGRDAAEVRRVLDELFTGTKLPPDLRHLQRCALAQTWWRQSVSEAAAGQKRSGWRSFCRATRLAPTYFSPVQYVQHIARIIIA
jgi:glycosyltransferase involved in cell wall biosynthesis